MQHVFFIRSRTWRSGGIQRAIITRWGRLTIQNGCATIGLVKLDPVSAWRRSLAHPGRVRATFLRLGEVMGR